MKRRAIIGAVVLVILGAAGMACYRPWGRGPETLRLPGTVEVQEVRLGSKVGGRVAAVLVTEGQVVEPGQVLVRFERDELVARRDQAAQRVASAKAALTKANAGPLPEEVTEAKGAADAARARLAKAKAGFREENRRQAEHDLETAAADLKQAEEDFSRVKQVYGMVAGSLADYTAAVAALDRARGRFKAARATLDMMLAGSRPEDITEAEAELVRYEAKWKFLARGTRDEDKAAAYAALAEAEAHLAEAETNLREATVVAPEKAVVEVVWVRPGALVPAGQPAVRALRADDLWVKVFVPATDLGKLKLGQAVEVAVDSHPGKRFAGEVIQIASVSEFTPRNVQSLDERRHQVFAVKVRVTDPAGVFKSGMAAEVFVPLGG